MENKYVDKYIRSVERDVKYIDEAVRKGAYLSFEEWFDFVFKSEVASFKSTVISKYEASNPKEYGVIKLGSDIMAAILSVQMCGFTDANARKMVKSLIKRFNKLRSFHERISFYCKDSDGVLTYIIESADMSFTSERQITSRDSLCSFLSDLWAMFVYEAHLFNKETREFMLGRMVNELTLVMTGKKPTPYIGRLRCNTLEAVLLERTDFDSQSQQTPKNGDSKIKVFQATGTNNSKPM